MDKISKGNRKNENMSKKEEKKKKFCRKAKVLKAIKALKKLSEHYFENELKKTPLLAETAESPILLQVQLKKIPPKRLLKTIKIHLPHSLITDTSEVCLITGDLEKHNRKAEIEPVVMHYKDLLKKHDITNITEVIPLRQLRTEYSTFESRRHLVDAYDVFLTDKKIVCYLPKLLGKFFFRKRKFPFPINMTTSNLKDQVEKALTQTEFTLTCRGNSCSFAVARLSMKNSKILENIMASVKLLADKLPGNLPNIHGLYIKIPQTKAIPIYISYEIPSEHFIWDLCEKEEVEAEELSTLPDKMVKVYSDGRVKIV